MILIFSITLTLMVVLGLITPPGGDEEFDKETVLMSLDSERFAVVHPSSFLCHYRARHRGMSNFKIPSNLGIFIPHAPMMVKFRRVGIHRWFDHSRMPNLAMEVVRIGAPNFQILVNMHRFTRTRHNMPIIAIFGTEERIAYSL